MTWINIAKPTSSIWTSINPRGKETYDQSTISYDDADTYYDGVNPNQWTDIAKPSVISGTVTILPGMATGLIMPPTYATQYVFDIGNDPWTRVNKPT